MIALLVTFSQVVGIAFALLIVGVIVWSLAMNDDAPPVDESRMDCFCRNVGTKELHESCDDCGRYAELGGE